MARKGGTEHARETVHTYVVVPGKYDKRNAIRTRPHTVAFHPRLLLAVFALFDPPVLHDATQNTHRLGRSKNLLSGFPLRVQTERKMTRSLSLVAALLLFISAAGLPVPDAKGKHVLCIILRVVTAYNGVGIWQCSIMV